MKVKSPRFVSFILIVIITLCFTGCNFTASIESLLAPPKLTEEQTAIYQALLSSKGSGISLKYPKSGDYRSAFVLQDIDDEPTDEAVVFYEAAGYTGTPCLWINFLDQTDGKWVSVYDLSVFATDIEKVNFSTLGDSANKDIILTYSITGQTDKLFSVIKYENRTPTEIFGSNYTVLDINDIDGDGDSELFIINNDKNALTSVATTYGWQSGTFTSISSVALDPSATEYISIKQGKLSGNATALFIDYSKGDSTYGTDVIYCYGTRMVNPIYYEGTSSSERLNRRVNSYSGTPFCMDIDGDGITELPATTVLPGYINLTKPEQVCGTIWYYLRDMNILERKYYGYYSVNNDYAFMFPSRWEGLVTATVASSGSEVTFWEAAPTIGELTHPLLSIKSVAKGSEPPEGWKLYSTDANETYDYYVKYGSDNTALALTEDELRAGMLFVKS